MFLKNLSLKIKFYSRDFRYSNYIKLKSIRKKNLVDIEQFNKNFLNRDNELTEIMKKHSSDKGNLYQNHNYTDFYHFLFKDIRRKNLNIFEVGLGSINPDIPYNMAPINNYSPLSSLRGWRDYFSNSFIYGADIDRSILKNEERIKTFFVDMFKKESILSMWRKIGKKMDIIIDDGFHSFEANTIFFENSVEFLDHNGIYIIEDIDRIPRKVNKFFKYFNRKDFEWQFIDIKHSKNIKDNCLILIKKRHTPLTQ
jgi:hypothetical protein